MYSKLLQEYRAPLISSNRETGKKKKRKEKKMKASSIFFLISLIAVLGACSGGELRKNFYEETCPEAENIVHNIVWKNAALNPTLAAKLLRVHFHDCFVRVTITHVIFIYY